MVFVYLKAGGELHNDFMEFGSVRWVAMLFTAVEDVVREVNKLAGTPQREFCRTQCLPVVSCTGKPADVSPETLHCLAANCRKQDEKQQDY